MQVFGCYGRDMGGRDIVVGAGGLSGFDGGWGGCSTGVDRSVLGLRGIHDTRGE